MTTFTHSMVTSIYKKLNIPTQRTLVNGKLYCKWDSSNKYKNHYHLMIYIKIL